MAAPADVHRRLDLSIPYAALVLAALLTVAQPASSQVRLERAFPALPEDAFSFPVDLATPPDGSNRLFVVERSGVIKVLENDPAATSLTWWLDIRDRVQTGGEEGLLGMAFHPDFAANGAFFLFYSAPDPLRSVLARYHVDPDDPSAPLLESEEILLEIPQPAPGHNGGQIRFGPDGYLYVSVGDGSGTEQHDPNEWAEDLSDLHGKFLRLDVDGGEEGSTGSSGEPPYGIPPDNPFVDSAEARPEIFAYGFRNPWRFSFDGEKIWTGDVGLVEREEIDLVEKGGNYGWDVWEGTHCHEPAADCGPLDSIPPVFEYGRDQGRAVIGGAVYRGDDSPWLHGRYVYADYASTRIWALQVDEDGIAENTLLLDADLGRIVAFGTDPDDNLYVMGMRDDGVALQGDLYRLVASATTAAEPAWNPHPEQPESDVVLEGVRPNPFRTSTSASFTLRRPAYVELEVYDLLGRRVDALERGPLPTGTYRRTWNAGGSPAGTYFLRLTVDGRFAGSRRMVHVK